MQANANMADNRHFPEQIDGDDVAAGNAAGASPAGAMPASPPSSTLERMPKWLICIPLVLQWIGLALRYGSVTLPSAANPRITAGGLVGEGKLEYFAGMGSIAREATARHCAISTHCMPSSAELLQMMSDAALAFPVIAKPDLGLCGHGVRRVDDMAQLRHYLSAFPKNEVVVLQEYLPQDGEAGIFYVRDPHADQGRIIGLALREFPRVTGDGVSTVAELIAREPRLQRLSASASHECRADFGRILDKGAMLRLSTIGSTRVGGLYRDGACLITPQLQAAIDAIARDMPSFHAGRFDVRFGDARELAAGRGFKIMEINGAGSEAIQAWDPDVSLVRGLRTIFAKQRVLFSIGAKMRSTGVRPIGLLALARLNQRQIRLITQYPPSN